MNIWPWLGFFERRGSQIKALFASGKGQGDSHLLTDLLKANLGIIKQRFPVLAADGLADDFSDTLNKSLNPPS